MKRLRMPKRSLSRADCFNNKAFWTCFSKVESSPKVKGELDDEATTVYKGI
jgi:hypothetical protein